MALRRVLELAPQALEELQVAGAALFERPLFELGEERREVGRLDHPSTVAPDLTERRPSWLGNPYLSNTERISVRLARRTALPAVLAAGALLLTACGSSPAPSSSSPAATAEGGFPLRIANTYGTTEIPSPPTRAASVSWGNQDVALALGVVPVGMAASTYGDDDGDGILPWAESALEELGGDAPALYDETDGIAFEKVADTTPDVILGAYSGLSAEDYATLSEIAPTVSFPEVAFGTTWRDMALIDGEALGLRSQAEQVVADVDSRIEEAVAAHPSIAGKTVAYTSINPADTGSIYVYTPVDARVKFLDDLGMSTPDSIAAQGGDAFYITISAENADLLSVADILVTYGDESTLAALQADPLLGKVPAIADGAVVIVPNATPLAAATSGPTVLSIPYALDEYVGLFAAAADRVK
jgi:iron complex transport system substrate-binding protein